MDYKDVHNMSLSQLKKELARIQGERYAIKSGGRFANFHIDRRYLAVRHAISKIERLNTNSTQT